MALIYNGKTINAGATIKYKGTSLQKIIYKGVTVWQKYTASSASLSSYYAQLCTSMTPMIAASSSPGDPDNFYYDRGTMSGNALSWAGKGAYVKANCNCKLTVSGNIRPTAPHAIGFKGWYYKNSTQIKQIFWVSSTTIIDLAYTITLNAGDTFSIRTGPEMAGTGAFQFGLDVTFKAEPI